MYPLERGSMEKLEKVRSSAPDKKGIRDNEGIIFYILPP